MIPEKYRLKIDDKVIDHSEVSVWEVLEFTKGANSEEYINQWVEEFFEDRGIGRVTMRRLDWVNVWKVLKDTYFKGAFGGDGEYAPTGSLPAFLLANFNLPSNGDENHIKGILEGITLQQAISLMEGHAWNQSGEEERKKIKQDKARREQTQEDIDRERQEAMDIRNKLRSGQLKQEVEQSFKA